MENSGKRWKAMEGNRRLWNLIEVSGKCENILWVSYVSERRSSLGLSTKKEEMDYVSGRQSVTYRLLTQDINVIFIIKPRWRFVIKTKLWLSFFFSSHFEEDRLLVLKFDVCPMFGPVVSHD